MFKTMSQAMRRSPGSNRLVDWEAVRGVIFDVDGTLYDQRALRRRLATEMLGYYVFRPWRFWDLKILWDFRRMRDGQCQEAVTDLEQAQYAWASAASGAPPERVREIVREWMFQRPLCHLATCRHPGLLEFLGELKDRGVHIAFFSDYPIQDKLSALGLPAAPSFCATDKTIDRLKPDPKSLIVAAEAMGLPVSNCLCIGDRDDRDGEAARRAGMPYLLLDQNTSGRQHHFQGYSELIADLKLSNNSPGSRSLAPQGA